MNKIFSENIKDRNLTIKRDDLYVGAVVSPFYITQLSKEDADLFFDEKMVGKLHINSWYEYRSILFVPNQDLLAQDVLYGSPNYPIANISDNEVVTGAKIVIKDAYCLSELLKYKGYGEDLDFKDIKEIRKLFFSGHYGMDNCELFGMREFMPEDATYYKNGQELKGLQRKIKILKEKIDRMLGHRMFGSISTNVLPEELMDVLDTLGNNSVLDIMRGFDKKIDTFKPDKSEGQIKALRRF